MGKASRARREKIRPILEAQRNKWLDGNILLWDAIVHSPDFVPDLDLLEQATVIRIDHIIDRITSDWEWRPGAIGFPGEKQFRRYSANAFPPFEVVFLEGWFPKRIRNSAVQLSKFGVLVAAYDVDDEDNTNKEIRLSIVGYSLNSERNWIYRLPVYSVCDIDRNGQYIKSAVAPFDISSDMQAGPLEALAQSCALLAFSLINCQNISLEDAIPSNDEKMAYEGRFNTPVTKYKVLRVNPVGKRHDREDKPQQQFDIMPLHIRRGNFAHYTDDAPLFGKYTGTFWRPATAVGNAKNGVVVKDYKLGEPA